MASRQTDLETVAALARPIVERVIWCTVATAGADGVPRTRLMHPVWWWDGEEPVGLVTARPTPTKVAHLAATPMASCFYWDPAHDTVSIDVGAEWLAPDERAAAWEAVRSVAPPVGFDPALIWPDGPAAADCGFLRFRATRIVVSPAGGESLRWRAPDPG